MFGITVVHNLSFPHNLLHREPYLETDPIRPVDFYLSDEDKLLDACREALQRHNDPRHATSHRSLSVGDVVELLELPGRR